MLTFFRIRNSREWKGNSEKEPRKKLKKVPIRHGEKIHSRFGIFCLYCWNVLIEDEGRNNGKGVKKPLFRKHIFMDHFRLYELFADNGWKNAFREIKGSGLHFTSLGLNKLLINETTFQQLDLTSFRDFTFLRALARVIDFHVTIFYALKS